ncbi:hypothetical protein IFM89_011342 [Coptis chinensis]|uniref:Uncharacterized protein n=1 Tax=Coptis chinensis TaxID=261450 RepID=A0A835IXG4_9MAGN|nr:hypothetical protein IFM89_011342 [Coptis chinensis]
MPLKDSMRQRWDVKNVYEGSLIWDRWGEDPVGPYEHLDALSPFNPAFERNATKGWKIHGLTPSSPPCKNYEITPRTPSASRGHGPTIEPCSISGMD